MPFDLVILNLVISPMCARIFSAHYKGKPFTITLMSFNGGNIYIHTEEYFAAMKKNKEKKKWTDQKEISTLLSQQRIRQVGIKSFWIWNT